MEEARRTLDRRRGGRKEVCCVSSVRLVGASGTDARFTAPLDEQLSNPRKLGRPRLFRQRTSKAAPDDVDAMTTVTSFASSTRASSGRVVTDAGTTTPERTPASPPEQVAGLAERRSKRSAVVRLASAPLLDVDDEPLSP